jgi:CDGSH-type Zn-finger protein
MAVDRSFSRKYRIKVIRNGPYFVSGGLPLVGLKIVLDADGQCLAWAETKIYPERQTYYLCRCGESNAVPYCDSMHTDIHFDGTETASRRSYADQCRKFSGPNLDLTDAKALCAHVGFCDRAGGTWNLVSRSDDQEARKIATEEAWNCPSGRLVVWDKKGTAIETALQPSIAVIESPTGKIIGPFWVRGGIQIESANGETYEIRNRVTLCGCGRSSNKPFCDGTHRQKKSQ